MAVSVTNATGARGLENVHHDHNAAALPLQDAARQGARPRLTELQSTALSYLADVKSGGETVFPCACNYKDEQCARVQKACKLLYEAGVLFVRGDEGTHQSFKLTKPNEKAAKVVANAAAVVRNASRALCSGHAGAPGLRVAPRTGRTILFFSNGVRDAADPRTWHGSCSVVAGQKVTMQRFFFAPQFDAEIGDHSSAVFRW